MALVTEYPCPWGPC